MPLGQQFSNTYWEDPTSKSVMSSTELPTPKGELPTKEQRKPQIAEGFGTSDSPQGMLFSPYAYTGLKDDPTVPAEQRMGAINKALHLGDLEHFKKRKALRETKNAERVEYNRNRKPGQDRRNLLPEYGDPVTSFKKHEALGKAANALDIPTREYETGINAPTYPTDWGKGWASFGEIHVGVGRDSSTVTTEKTTYEPSDKPIVNKGFWNQYEKKIQHPYNIHTILEEDGVHWQNDKGHVITGDVPEHVGKVIGEYPSQNMTMDWLKENNYHPNVYPTKGEGGKKHAVGEELSLESGPHPLVGGEYTYQTWHTRFEPDTTKEPKVTQTRKNVQGEYVANKRTLAHELGHTLEPHDKAQRDLTKRSGRQIFDLDPVSEGYADALADRAHHYSGQFEKHLTNTQLRAKDISETGYTSSYHAWNAEERALYSATRFHLAAHPERRDEMPTRKGLGETLLSTRYSRSGEIPTTKLMLGHMYENMPHVRPVLHELGFGKTAQTAHEEFMSRVPNKSAMRGKQYYDGKQREVYEQPELPGL